MLSLLRNEVLRLEKEMDYQVRDSALYQCVCLFADDEFDAAHEKMIEAMSDFHTLLERKFKEEEQKALKEWNSIRQPKKKKRGRPRKTA